MATVESVEKELAKMAELIQTYKSQLDQCTAKTRHKDTVLKQLQGKHDRLQGALRDAEYSARQAEKHTNVAVEKQMSLETELKERGDRQCNDRVSRAEEALRVLHADKISQQSMSFTAKIEEISEKLSVCGVNVEECRSGRVKDNKDAEEAAASMQREMESTLKSRVQQYDAQLSALKNELDRKNETGAKEIETMRTSLRECAATAASDNERAKDSIQELQNRQLAEMKKASVGCESRVEALKREMNDESEKWRSTHQETVKKFNQQATALQRKCSKEVEEQRKSGMQENGRLAQMLQEKVAHIAELTSKVSEQTERLQNEAATGSAMERMAKERDDLEDALRESRGAHLAATEQLKASQDELTKLNNRVRNLTKALENTKTLLNTCNGDRSALQETQRQLERFLKETKGQLGTLSSTHNELKAAHKLLSERYGRLRDAMDSEGGDHQTSLKVMNDKIASAERAAEKRMEIRSEELRDRYERALAAESKVRDEMHKMNLQMNEELLLMTARDARHARGTERLYGEIDKIAGERKRLRDVYQSNLSQLTQVIHRLQGKLSALGRHNRDKVRAMAEESDAKLRVLNASIEKQRGVTRLMEDHFAHLAAASELQAKSHDTSVLLIQSSQNAMGGIMKSMQAEVKDCTRVLQGLPEGCTAPKAAGNAKGKQGAHCDALAAQRRMIKTQRDYLLETIRVLSKHGDEMRQRSRKEGKAAETLRGEVQKLQSTLKGRNARTYAKGAKLVSNAVKADASKEPRTTTGVAA